MKQPGKRVPYVMQPLHSNMDEFIRGVVPIDTELLDNWICPLCGIKFMAKHGLLTHFKGLTHSTNLLPNFRKYINESVEYLATRKTRQEVLTCSHCNKKFATDQSRKVHEKQCVKKMAEKIAKAKQRIEQRIEADTKLIEHYSAMINKKAQ